MYAIRSYYELPYALFIGVLGILVGGLPSAYGVSPFLAYPAGVAVIFLVLRFYGKHDLDSPQFTD